jgi:hypothetical protein
MEWPRKSFRQNFMKIWMIKEAHRRQWKNDYGANVCSVNIRIREPQSQMGH